MLRNRVFCGRNRPRDSSHKGSRMDSERRYGLGYVLAWPFFEDLEEKCVELAFGGWLLNVSQNCRRSFLVKFPHVRFPGGRRRLLGRNKYSELLPVMPCSHKAGLFSDLVNPFQFGYLGCLGFSYSTRNRRAESVINSLNSPRDSLGNKSEP